MLTMADDADVLLRVVAAHDAARCVVMTRHEGRAPKQLSKSGALYDVQPLTHHAWNRPMLGGWVLEPSPLPSLGVVAVKAKERSRVQHPQSWVEKRDAGTAVLPMTTWPALIELARTQWRWEHERAAVTRDDARAEAAALTRLAAAAATPRASKRAFFAAWQVTPALINDAEATVNDAAKELEKLRGAAVTQRLETLERTLLRLGARYDHSFDDDELEDIGEAVKSLARGL